MTKSSMDWIQKQLKPVQHGRIVCAVADDDDPEYWGIKVETPDEREFIIWVYQDEEGNGPGCIDVIEQTPKPVR